ncbi:hypothetical protein [Novosphingobium flavum]|uniref:hypothetical protein n=1 Tax=Novosphingobium flavum TaxID=1778672 RepID=UPI003CCCFF32
MASLDMRNAPASETSLAVSLAGAVALTEPGIHLHRSRHCVAIGQAAIISDRVRIYQAITLGARSFSADAEGRLIKDERRHASSRTT